MSDSAGVARMGKRPLAPLTPGAEQGRQKLSKVADAKDSTALSPAGSNISNSSCRTAAAVSIKSCDQLPPCPSEAPDTAAEGGGNYISGTTLVKWGWIQPCRACNEYTGKSVSISCTGDGGGREVFLCSRCQSKRALMVAGAYPPSAPAGDSIEPLCYWVPQHVPRMRPMSAKQRQSICDALLLKQDDAWQAVIGQP